MDLSDSTSNDEESTQSILSNEDNPLSDDLFASVISYYVVFSCQYIFTK